MEIPTKLHYHLHAMGTWWNKVHADKIFLIFEISIKF